LTRAQKKKKRKNLSEKKELTIRVRGARGQSNHRDQEKEGISGRNEGPEAKPGGFFVRGTIPLRGKGRKAQERNTGGGKYLRIGGGETRKYSAPTRMETSRKKGNKVIGSERREGNTEKYRRKEVKRRRAKWST